MRPVGSTLTSPRVGEPDGPAGTYPPSRACRTCVDLVGGARQPRHHLGGGELQHALRPRAVARPEHLGARPPATFAGVPAERLHARPRAAGASASSRSTASAAGARPGRRRASVSSAGTSDGAPGSASSAFSSSPKRAASAARRPGSAPPPAPHLRGAQHGEHQVDPRLAGRRAAEDVQPVADLHVLDLAQVAVDVQDEVVELARRPAASSDVQVVVQLRRPGPASRSAPAAPAAWPGPAPATVAYSSSSCSSLAMSPYVSARAIGGTRWSTTVGVPAPLGLGALARVVDDERVDQRQVAEHGVRRALAPTARGPCRAATPACRACPGGRRRRRRTLWSSQRYAAR